MTIFLRLIEVPIREKERALQRACSEPSSWFIRSPESLRRIPGTPFTYWAPEKVLSSFERLPPFSSSGREAWVGLQTNDDFRWLRLLWEEGNTDEGPETTTALVPFAKGGSYSPFYSAIKLGVRWGADGYHLKNWKLDELRRGTITANNSRCWNETKYFRPGLTWPRRTDGLSFRVLPSGSIFGDKGPGIFDPKNDKSQLMALCAILNSTPFGYLMGVQLARTELAQSYEVGLVQQTPIPTLGVSSAHLLGDLAAKSWLAAYQMSTIDETSSAFLLPNLLAQRIFGFSVSENRAKLIDLANQIDDLVYHLYDFDLADAEAINTWSRTGRAGRREVEPPDNDDTGADDLTSLLSWAVGVAFGRFDPRLATVERSFTSSLEPFAPVEARSPAMDTLTGTARRPFLVDDPGHPDDISVAVGNVLHRLDLPDVALPEGDALRTWIARSFFSEHIKIYSASRRKAPIWWQLSSGSGRYSVWLAYQELTADSLYRVLQDLILPKLAHERTALSAIVSDAGGQLSQTAVTSIEQQQTLVDELEALRQECERIAPLWKPNFDDGVMMNFAPLWRLVPQNKSWQTELRHMWNDLCAGKYDWAHLAMHLWPERVVAKCAQDRSLAIAHGLEREFWFDDEKGKWNPQKNPLRPIEELVGERSSPAVKDALKSLLEAPEPVVFIKRTRKGKAN